MLLSRTSSSRGRGALGGRRRTPTTPAGTASRTDPFPCPAAGCDFVAEFMTAAHLILVWEERDDPNLLRHAERAKQVGRNPRVVAYERVVRPERLVLRLGGGRAGPCTAFAASVTHRFGARRPWSLGVEEELFLVDARDASRPRRVLAAWSASRTSGLQARGLRVPRRARRRPSLPDADDVLAELQRLRARARAASGRARARASTRPARTRSPAGPASRSSRCRALRAAWSRSSASGSTGSSSAASTSTSRCPTRTPACAPSRRSSRGCRVLLALSANSPFAEGEDTGRRSERAERLLEMPTGGTPPRPPRLGRLGGGDRRRRRPAATGTPGRGPSTGRSRCA